MNVTYNDIKNRYMNKNYINKSINMNGARLYTKSNKLCVENAINSIKYWGSLDDDINVAYDKALDIFEELCDSLLVSKSVLQTTCDILIESETKVRDQTQLANSLKNRLSRLKRKSIVKLDAKHNIVTNAVAVNIAKAKSAITINTSPAKISSPKSPAANNDESKEECLNMLYNKCLSIQECDRILNNYNNISKRFNIDNIASRIMDESDLYQACMELASYIDTYDSPFKNKYNTVLETALYLFNKYGINYPKSKIIEGVTDYFIFTNSINEEQVLDIRDIINISVLYENKDFLSLSYLFNDEPAIIKEDNSLEIINNSHEVISILEEENGDDEPSGSIVKDLKKAVKGNPDERKDEKINKMIDDFRKQCVKNKDSKANSSAFKSLLTKIFSLNPEQVATELPNIFSLIRAFIDITAFIINPILGLLTVFTTRLLTIHITRKQMDKYIDVYKKEIKKVKEKIEKTDNDKKKETLEKYQKELEKDLDKLKYYASEHYTDKENDERQSKEYEDDFEFDDSFEFDNSLVDFDDSELDFKEMADIICAANMLSSICENLIDDSVEGIVTNNIFKLDDDTIDNLVDFSIAVPMIIERDKLKEALILHRNELRSSSRNIGDYIRIDCLNENIIKLNNAPYTYSMSSDIRDTLLCLTCLEEMVKLKSDYVLEMNFVNTIKMAMNNLKKKAINLSDKEKNISTSIDASANSASKALEDLVKNGNREAVIKGRLVPSMSKCIKLALGLGAAWIVSPVIAIIGAVGWVACSVKMRSKERQLLLDEIEVELKMCDRYISDAENKNDLKKVKQYETIKRTLQRQHQRIKYKMLVVHNQKLPEDYKKDDFE